MKQMTLPHPAIPITDSGTKNEILLHIDIIPLLLLPTAAPRLLIYYTHLHTTMHVPYYTLFQ